MSRHLKLDRLVSGVLFSAPADLATARPDVPGRGRKNFKAPGLTPSPRNLPTGRPDHRQPYGLGHTEELGLGDVPTIDTAGEDDVLYANTYAVFPMFGDGQQPMPPLSPPPSIPSPTATPQVPSPNPEPPRTLCLPILSVSVDVTVDGTVATTELKQSFRNPSELVIPEARHTFPLYDGAIVTSFECAIGDLRILRGVVKPKNEARQSFEKAKEQKREAAALLEELTPEIFETSLGNIPPATTVEIKMTYIHELKIVPTLQEGADEVEGLVITLPTSIAPRYGGSVQSTFSSELNEKSLEIRLRVIDNDHIDLDGCHAESGHDVIYEGRTSAQQTAVWSLAELANLTPQSQLVWHYVSKSAVLKRDFIFVIQMQGTYRSNSRAILSPADESGRAAMMVSIRPHDLFSNAIRPQSFTGELLFLIDRSASMGWTEEGSNELKINAMRDAMSLALSGLPETCAFNIISFGSEVRGMWAESRLSSDSLSLKHARAYVSYIQADMGGTEVLLAAQAAVKHRTQSRRSTQIILITDGEVEGGSNESILGFVWKTRKDLGDKIRFFTLGIGDRVSHRMMETIAELGGGYCDIVDVVQKPRWEDRLNRMLRSAMEPDSWTCNLELGPGFQRRSMTDFNIGTDNASDMSSISYIQAPYPTPSLYPYAHRSIFFLLDLRGGKAPVKVTIAAATPGAKKKTHELDVEPSKTRAIHHLAAKAALQDLEDEIKRGHAETDTARNNAESLGTQYSVTSKWTSFVAVASDEADKRANEVEIYKSLLKEMDIEDALDVDVSDDESEYIVGSPDEILEGGYQSPSRSRSWSRQRDQSPPPVFHSKFLGGPGPARSRRKAARPACWDDANMIALSSTEAQTDPSRVARLRQRTSSYLSDDNIGEKDLEAAVAAPASPGGERQPQEEKEEEKEEDSYPEMAKYRHLDLTDYGGAPRAVWPDSFASRIEAGTPFGGTAVIDGSILPLHISPDRRKSEDRDRYEGVLLNDGGDGGSSDQSIQNIDSPERDYERAASPAASATEVGSDALSDIEEADPYKPSAYGPITWKDAVGCLRNGLFVLPGVISAKLYRHFCANAVARLGEELQRLPNFSTLTDENVAVVVDTLMMIVYFGTHLAAEEDSWYLIMDKAEGTVLQALDLDEAREDALEPVLAMLKLSMEHVHYEEALKDSQVRRNLRDGTSAEPIEKTCQVCRDRFGTERLSAAGMKGFVCCSDACYDADGRKVWDTWDMFWKHQVDRGHMVCPEGMIGKHRV